MAIITSRKNYLVEHLLPHRGSAILLNELTAYGNDWVESSTNHHKSVLYQQADGSIPAWVGIEYMVQTVGLFAGLQALASGKPVKPGFLLGTRLLDLHINHFVSGMPVVVRAELRYLDDAQVAMFACSIKDEVGRVLVESEIKATIPDKIDDKSMRLQHG